MKPNHPLQIFKATARYLSIPFKRASNPLEKAAIIAPKPEWERLKRLYIDRDIILRTQHVTRYEFGVSIIPWLLQGRSFTIHTVGAVPDFFEKFCRKHNGQYINTPVTKIKPKSASAPQSVKKPSKTDETSWFARDPGHDLRQALTNSKPVYLYFPWIPEHGDAIIAAVQSDAYTFAPFDIVKDVSNNDMRRDAFRFARNNPRDYRRMVIRRLAPIASQVSGFVFTFDWAPVTRIIVEVCQSLKIPTILIPHESVFIDRELYYRDPINQASRPLSDYALVWGNMQKEVFEERGYSPERIVVTGAPKFDAYWQPALIQHESFCRLFGLDESRKTILFATQPLDSQTNTETARDAQRLAISDLLRYCERNGHQLIVRMPPSRDDILGAALKKMLEESEFSAIDDARFYLLPPHEVIKHVDVVASINSTMLFEGVLAGKLALAMRYIEFASIWDDVGINAARNLNEASTVLDVAFNEGKVVAPKNLDWAAQQFGVGCFDGKAAERIRAFLTEFLQAAHSSRAAENPDVAAMPTYPELEGTTQLYVPTLLGANTLIRVAPAVSLEKLGRLSGVDTVIQWGSEDSLEKIRLRHLAKILGKRMLFVEDGLIRSVDIGLSRTPGLSLLIDELAPYYDSTKPTGLERRLKSGDPLSEEQLRYAREAVADFCALKLSKYNHAPLRDLEMTGPAILVLDQRMNDQSVVKGGASAIDFEAMVTDALKDWPDHTILIKLHPDAISGLRESYLSRSRLLNAGISSERIVFIDEDINPHSLFEKIDAVYTVSSGMGFEAVLAGKPVTCYGIPFYSGWGITHDKKVSERRGITRTVEDVFHHAYIEASRYIDPDTSELIDVRRFMAMIANKKV